jgi:hypothetical protein
LEYPDQPATIKPVRAIGAVGYDTTSVTSADSDNLQSPDTPTTACLTAVGVTNQPIDTRLQTIIKLWDTLPESARRAILAMIQSAKQA